jgi:uncharacterized protein
MFFLPAIVLLTAASPTAMPIITPEVRAIVKELNKGGPTDAIARLESRADEDDGARVLLGEIYFFGMFAAPRDEERGCAYFEPLASKYGEVAHNLGTCFFNKVGARTDQATARAHYRKGIELGWPDSACALGNMMIAGQGGEKDVTGGLDLCKSAAEKGVAHAQADVGTYLLMGKIVPKDAVAARYWLAQAAKQKHANASFLLGQIYWKGDGVAEDRAIAAKWLKVAYDSGRQDASFLLAKEAMGRMLVKDRDRTTISREVLPEAIHWLEMTQRVDGSAEEKAENADLLASLYEVRDKTAGTP